MFNPAAAFPAGGPIYDGSGVLNSGLNVLLSPGQNFAPTFTAPGTYDFLCLVHPMMMKGTLTVQEAGAAVPHEQVDVDAIAADEIGKQIELGQALAATHGDAATPTSGTSGGTVWDVQAGDEGDEFVLLRYFPDPLTIKAGDTVRWTDASKMEPHTVTFLGGEAPPDLVVPEPQEGDRRSCCSIRPSSPRRDRRSTTGRGTPTPARWERTSSHSRV
jgi:plastocyanin